MLVIKLISSNRRSSVVNTNLCKSVHHSPRRAVKVNKSQIHDETHEAAAYRPRLSGASQAGPSSPPGGGSR